MRRNVYVHKIMFFPMNLFIFDSFLYLLETSTPFVTFGVKFAPSMIAAIRWDPTRSRRLIGRDSFIIRNRYM